MKIIPGKYEPIVAVAKANLSGWYVLLALLFLSVFMSGCEKEEMIAECWELGAECNQEVTATTVICGYGAFGNVWLKTADGSYLQPWHNLAGQNALVSGQKYRIGYKEVERDEKYKNVFTCMAAVPAAKAIALTCLTAATNN
ncbi:hypothetical protein [Pontibacter sp. H249]|uniref:hypothetical protein n=1 Tax=Pontibacter sp. H249 TaxID=3133420 RepID=UPI0030BA3448